MCGIAGLIPKDKRNSDYLRQIASMSAAIKHRGPDGEGFLVVSSEYTKPYFKSVKPLSANLPYIPQQILPEKITVPKVLFAHRRLSIIDLSAAGHQPMCDASQQIWLTFNGEIYNYIELKEELQTLGYHFVSHSDTEVIIAAYLQWGAECVKRFNGMWAFCLYDARQNRCFASRDRLGVKPFYYMNNTSCFAFASEQKAFVEAGLIRASVSQNNISNYLLQGLLETESENFFEGVYELLPGNNLIYDLASHNFSLQPYYALAESYSNANDALSDKQLSERISETFEKAVRLRLRSDVEVGTCLSGGIDSSALAVTMAEMVNHPLHCFTAVFKNEKINEEAFAASVVEKIKGKHHKSEPTLENFLKDADDLIYSQDVPIWSTSTYAQHRVMQLAAENKIKVVLDGQGADELFAGYHHHYVAKWNGLFKSGKLTEAFSEMNSSSKSIPSPYSFYLKELLKSKTDLKKKKLGMFFKDGFLEANPAQTGLKYFDSVNGQLADDIQRTRLKIFLKCEDRCGMWHSVESRTPFSDDIDLINLAFSFNGNRKIKNGISKYLLREAVKSKLPQKIYQRYDKMGFETPMDKWMQSMWLQMISEIKTAGFDFIKAEALDKANKNDAAHQQFVFKLFVLNRWKKMFRS